MNALRALEAAGRHGSFTKAAEELNVTPGAVSRQIKLLEEGLGIELFERKSGGLEATDRCDRYSRSLTEIFNRMELATKQLLNSDYEKQLHVSCSMTFTLRWLVPRISSFHRRHPEWDLRFGASTPPPRFADADGIDVFIQLNDGRNTDLFAEPMVPNDLMPVCSPALLAKSPPINEPADLHHFHLLHSMLRPGHWPTWLERTGTDAVDPQSGTFLGSSTLAYKAAIEGLGIAMAQVPLVYDDLKAGRLVPALPIIVEDQEQFQLIWHKDMAPQKVLDFREWAFEEAEMQRLMVEAFTEGFQRLPV